MFSNPGISYIINPYDDHALHLEEHRLARKQPEYQSMKLDDMEKFVQLEITFETHNEQHTKFLAKQMKAQEDRLAKLEGAKKGG